MNKYKKILKEINKSFLIGLLSLFPILIGIWAFSILYNYFIIIISFVYDLNDSFTISMYIFFMLFILLSIIGFKIRKMEKIFILTSLENTLSKTPIIGFIINTVKQLIKLLFPENEEKYLGVVKAPFNGGKTLGLVTHFEEKENLYTVFIPTAPNPTSGFVMYYDKVDLEFVDINVNDVFKIQLSLGIISD